MNRNEANQMLIERFKQLNKVAAEIDGKANPEALCALCDSAHKMFITLSNAGALDATDIHGPASSNFMS